MSQSNSEIAAIVRYKVDPRVLRYIFYRSGYKAFFHHGEWYKVYKGMGKCLRISHYPTDKEMISYHVNIDDLVDLRFYRAASRDVEEGK